MALHRNLVIRGGSITDEMQNSDIDTDTSSSESDMDLGGEDRPPALPERDADDNATLLGSTMDCDEATLAGSAADGDEVDHLSDLPSADDCELSPPAILGIMLTIGARRGHEEGRSHSPGRGPRDYRRCALYMDDRGLEAAAQKIS